MREFVMRHKVGAATIVASLVVAAFSIYSVPLNPPLGDCFGSLLSQDPLICYVLEQADRQSIIDVETVYDADGVLYFSLRQDDELSSNAYEFFEAKAVEFYDRWPDDVPVLSFYDECVEHLKPTYRECYLELGALPKSKVYDEIRFHTGGETARRLLPGWATWRQVWPAVAGGASGSSETPTTFDVSDVDMTNLPVDACPEVLYGDVIDVCSRDPDVALSIVGRHKGYFQIKDPPTDEAGLAALKEILVPCYNKAGPCTYMATTTVTSIVDGVETHTATRTEVYFEARGPGDLVIIPVKYSWEELARWVEILDRFATSRGNTIGIMRAEVSTNTDSWGLGTDAVWPLDSLRPVEHESHSELRETIAVVGFDAQKIADSLPTLLPLLSIPVDSVGVVATESRVSNAYSVPLVNLLKPHSRELTPPVRVAFAAGVPVPLLVLARNVGAVLVAGGIVALVLRLRRRRAPG